MKKKWVILCVASLGCLATSYILVSQVYRWRHSQSTHLCKRDPYFVYVPITLSSAQIPCVEMTAADKTITTRVDLGFSGDVKLPRDFLIELNQKSILQRVSYFGIRGKKYDSDVYEIPKLKIGGMTFYRAKAEEINQEFEKDAVLLYDEKKPPSYKQSKIGWKFFYNTNLFFDCKNSKIAFCDSLDTLREQGYPVDSFIETRLLLDRNLVEFEVMTEKGPIRCVLDSGSTLNLLNKDLENQSNEHMIFNPDNIDQHAVLNPENSDQMVVDFEDEYEMPVFKIGKKDFGPVNFQKIKTPFEFDAIIGMDFFKTKLVFIDFPNRKIYFYQK